MRNPDPALKGLVHLYAQFLYKRIASIPVSEDWQPALKNKFYRERAAWGSYYLNAMEILSDELKIKKYSNLDVLDISLAQKFSADFIDAITEAAAILAQKLNNYEKVIFTHKDWDMFDELYRTLKKTNCLTGAAYTGTIGEKMREVISLVENSPAMNSSSQEKSKFTLFSAIASSRGNSLKEKQEEYIKENKLRRKFNSLIEYIELVKFPFDKMEKTPELDIIRSYYDRVLNDAKRYQDLI